MAIDGDVFYEVRGYLPGRHSTRLDPRKGYTLFSGVSDGQSVPAARRGRRRARAVPMFGKWRERWATQIPLAGHALAVAGDTVLTAGVPLRPSYAAAELAEAYAGRLGGVLWAAAAKDGSKLAELQLPAPPVWDGIAVAQERCVLTLKDGIIMCLERR